MHITIYSTQTCPYCKQAKAFFDEHDVMYTDIDVTTDEIKQQEMIERSGQMGVPVIIVDNKGSEELMVGFDKHRLQTLLNIA